jgi:hypothetical protein
MSTHSRGIELIPKSIFLSLLFFLSSYYTTAEPVLFIAYGCCAFFSEREHAKSLSAAAAFVDFTLTPRPRERIFFKRIRK